MNKEYTDLVNHIMQYGIDQDCRNGSQRIIPHWSFTLDFSKSIDSAKLNLRRMYYGGVLGEFKTLIDPTPLTNVSQFEANGCNYWKDWAAEDGSITIDYANQMHPQLENLIEDIKTDPTSRRLMIDLWNPENVRDGSLSLPCCWHNLTFSVIAGVLHLKWTQRSVDTMIGLPADIFLAYLFMGYVVSETKLAMGTCMFALSNVHIYKEHFNGAECILERYRDGGDYSDKPIKFKLKE